METRVLFLGQEDPLEKGMENPTDRGSQGPRVHGVAKSDTTKQLTHTHTRMFYSLTHRVVASLSAKIIRKPYFVVIRISL